jgi:hypothetical protein
MTGRYGEERVLEDLPNLPHVLDQIPQPTRLHFAVSSASTVWSSASSIDTSASAFSRRTVFQPRHGRSQSRPRPLPLVGHRRRLVPARRLETTKFASQVDAPLARSIAGLHQARLQVRVALGDTALALTRRFVITGGIAVPEVNWEMVWNTLMSTRLAADYRRRQRVQDGVGGCAHS